MNNKYRQSLQCRRSIHEERRRLRERLEKRRKDGVTTLSSKMDRWEKMRKGRRRWTMEKMKMEKMEGSEMMKTDHSPLFTGTVEPLLFSSYCEPSDGQFTFTKCPLALGQGAHHGFRSREQYNDGHSQFTLKVD
ncbi:hypothetical protein Tco_0089775 [Tanacetum coccineum]